MTKMIAIAAASAAMLMTSSASFAQTAKNYYLVPSASGTERVMSEGDTGEGMEVMRGENGMAPSNCPAGGFYRSAENMINECGEGGASYELANPEAGSMMPSGTAWPQGAMMMRHMESGAQKSSEGVGGEKGNNN